jgi:hypothetical protein
VSAAFRTRVVLLAPFFCVLVTSPYGRADDSEIAQQLGLADLAGYRAALSGKATADDARSDDPPARVTFRDLWDRDQVFRGRRVTIEGRVARIFRQGPVGSFPPLAEVWVTSPAGDPFCVVFPQPATASVDDWNGGPPAHAEKNSDKPVSAASMPALGRKVRFTGTFLKTVSYAAGDGARLAPLVVGERPPVADLPSEAAHSSDRPTAPAGMSPRPSKDGHSPSLASPSLLRWVLGAALAALASLAAWAVSRRFLRSEQSRGGQWHAGRGGAPVAPVVLDPPLEFIEPSPGGQDSTAEYQREQ